MPWKTSHVETSSNHREFQLSLQDKVHKHWVPKPICFLDDHFKYSHEFRIDLKFSNCIFLQRFWLLFTVHIWKANACLSLHNYLQVLLNP